MSVVSVVSVVSAAFRAAAGVLVDVAARAWIRPASRRSAVVAGRAGGAAVDSTG